MFNNKKKAKNNGTHKFFLGALAGAAIGTIAGILTAPKSGKETRKDIADAGKKAVEAGKEGVEKAAKVVESKIKSVTDKK